jgi:hypothetical protein
MSEYGFFMLFGITQLIHSQEEVWTGFHKRWFFKMSRRAFVSFEVVFSAIILAYMIWPNLPFANVYMPLFALLMFANGVEHVVWAAIEKRYVPGLVTAPIFLIIFAFYFAGLVQAT